jgi:membrane associated rhomboid family serine protease
MIVLNMLSGAQSVSPDGTTGTDTLGHVGGAISGFLFGIAFFPRVKS